jgi:hypothetical protein
MRRVTLLLGVVLLSGGIAMAGAKGRRRGRVVRIERPRYSAPEAVRICTSAGTDEKLTCFGGAPEAEARLAMIDGEGVRGEAVVERSDPSPSDSCQTGSMHEATVRFDGGGLVPRNGQQAYSSFGTFAIQGVELGENAKVVQDAAARAPSGHDNEQVWIQIDRDGDGSADVLSTYYDCTAQIHDVPVSPTGQHVTPYCIDYWIKDSLDWRLGGRDVYFTCY